MRKLLLFFVLIFQASIVFCQTKVENNVEYKSVELPAGDSTFLALKDTAQKHMVQFIDSVQKHGADLKNYRMVVKSDFVEHDEHEHMWSQVYVYSNGSFKGIFIDSPFTIKNIKTGDKITIKVSDIEDWSITNLVTGESTGDFSEKYLESKH